jgi:hypothetical protein
VVTPCIKGAAIQSQISSLNPSILDAEKEASSLKGLTTEKAGSSFLSAPDAQLGASQPVSNEAFWRQAGFAGHLEENHQ